MADLILGICQFAGPVAALVIGVTLVGIAAGRIDV